MKSTVEIVKLLSRCESGADIYEQTDARFLTNLRYTHPSYINIICSEEPDHKGAYFHAQLTPRGKAYLKELRSEFADQYANI